MTTDKPGPAGKAKTDAREKRLEEALRQNLAKRKAQARGRAKSHPEKENT